MSSLGEFHHSEEGPSKETKITAWVIIAVIVGGIAFYVVDSGILNPPPVQASQNFPRGL